MKCSQEVRLRSRANKRQYGLRQAGRDDQRHWQVYDTLTGEMVSTAKTLDEVENIIETLSAEGWAH